MKMNGIKYQGFMIDINNIDNDAFNPVPGTEIARLLRRVASRIEDGCNGGIIRDMNGNTVGEFYFKKY